MKYTKEEQKKYMERKMLLLYDVKYSLRKRLPPIYKHTNFRCVILWMPSSSCSFPCVSASTLFSYALYLFFLNYFLWPKLFEPFVSRVSFVNWFFIAHHSGRNSDNEKEDSFFLNSKILIFIEIVSVCIHSISHIYVSFAFGEWIA